MTEPAQAGDPADPRPLCPVCGVVGVSVRCKLVCPRCRVVLENCNGD